VFRKKRRSIDNEQHGNSYRDPQINVSITTFLINVVKSHYVGYLVEYFVTNKTAQLKSKQNHFHDCVTFLRQGSQSTDLISCPAQVRVLRSVVRYIDIYRRHLRAKVMIYRGKKYRDTAQVSRVSTIPYSSYQ